jgi:hypothetical protein
MVRSIAVRGNQRLEPATIISYSNLQPGQTYTAETLDQALKELYATELFADVVITGAETGNIVITVQENPVINRIVIEGERRIKEDKIRPEIQLKPREIFTRSKVRADVDRIIELYKRRADSPRASSRRSSSSTRTASTSCSRFSRGRCPRSGRSTSSAMRRTTTDVCAVKCIPARRAACWVSSGRTTHMIPIGSPPTSRGCAHSI